MNLPRPSHCESTSCFLVKIFEGFWVTGSRVREEWNRFSGFLGCGEQSEGGVESSFWVFFFLIFFGVPWINLVLGNEEKKYDREAVEETKRERKTRG
ncbi:hypothetical protein ACFX2I_027285 [Malus domestica]